MALFDQLRYLKSQAIYWRYAVIADPDRANYLRYGLTKLAPSPYRPPHDQHRLILVPVPKVAGNSLSSALYGPAGAKDLAQTAEHTPVLLFKLADPKKFANYYKVAFVRNPWDRLVSAYSFMREGGMHSVDASWAARYIQPFADFSGFVRQITSEPKLRAIVLRSPHFIPQARFVCDLDGTLAVDFIGRYEALEEDFTRLCGELNIEAELPHTNVGRHADYRKFYNAETKQLVATLYGKDIEMFGYGFDG